jgi:class 3 adenylate cyclase
VPDVDAEPLAVAVSAGIIAGSAEGAIGFCPATRVGDPIRSVATHRWQGILETTRRSSRHCERHVRPDQILIRGILLARSTSARTRGRALSVSGCADVRTDCATVQEIPETRYAQSVDGAHIAFQVFGDGPPDLVFVTEGTVHLELVWEMPRYASVLQRMASFSRLVLFEPRGAGLSDPLGRGERPSLEGQAEDLLAALDAAGAARPAVVANSVAGMLAIFFAATYPHRTSSLVLDGCYARFAQAPDYPWGVPAAVLERTVSHYGPGTLSVEHGLRYTAPSAIRDPEFVAQWQRQNRSTYGPTAQRAMAEMAVFTDVRPLLPAVQAPTLVLCRRGDHFGGPPHARYLAEHIADAKLVELAGDDNLIYVGNSDADLDEIEEFLTGAHHAPRSDRVLATVLFTDIVGSTSHLAELGDRKWRDLIDAHDRAIRRQLERFSGLEVGTRGDGFVATFDGPGRAIECGCAMRDAVRALGIEIRVGLHTGEIEVREDHEIAGVAVHLAARVEQHARASEVLVSSTVKDLVAGSGIEFDDRGEHQLKGVPGTWRLFTVVA